MRLAKNKDGKPGRCSGTALKANRPRKGMGFDSSVIRKTQGNKKMISYNKDTGALWGYNGKINPTRGKNRRLRPDQVFRQRLIPGLESLGYERHSPDSPLERLFSQPKHQTYTEEYLMVRIKNSQGTQVEFSLEDKEIEARWPGNCSRLQLDDGFDKSLKLLMEKIK